MIISVRHWHASSLSWFQKAYFLLELIDQQIYQLPFMKSDKMWCRHERQKIQTKYDNGIMLNMISIVKTIWCHAYLMTVPGTIWKICIVSNSINNAYRLQLFLNTLIKNNVNYRITKYQESVYLMVNRLGLFWLPIVQISSISIYLVLHMRRKLFASSFMPIIAWHNTRHVRVCKLS